MIYIKDNFLPKEALEVFVNDKTDFEEYPTPGKVFWIKRVNKKFVDSVCNKLSKIEGCKVENVLAFVREAKQNQDIDWRIHNDSIIAGVKPDRAVVLYLSEDNNEGLNGTAFWSHKDNGDTYKGDTNKEFDRILTEDANDISKWELKTVIGHKQNRLLSYPCEYFHSKYPNELKNSRQVFVMFYKTIK